MVEEEYGTTERTVERRGWLDPCPIDGHSENDSSLVCAGGYYIPWWAFFLLALLVLALCVTLVGLWWYWKEKRKRELEEHRAVQNHSAPETRPIMQNNLH